MKDEDKTIAQLITELAELRQRISELEKSEVERMRTEDAYQAVVENSLQGLIVIQDFRVVFTNSAFAKISGYTVEELMSLSPEEVKASVHPEDQNLVWGRMLARLEGELMPQHYEFRGIRKNGEVRLLEMFVSTIEYGGRLAVQVAIIDVTENKQTKDLLVKSEEQYRKLVETMNDGLIVQNGKDLITYVNKKFCEMTGYSPEEIIGCSTTDLIAKLLNKEFQRIVKEQIIQRKKGILKPYEVTIKKKDGQEIYAIMSPELILDQDAHFNGSFAVLTDITERKHIEESLRKAEEQLHHHNKELEGIIEKRTKHIKELERQHRESEILTATGRMAARIAHEINNPLAGIKNSFLLIKDAIPENHQYYQYVGMIEREINRIAYIVRRMYDLYRQDPKVLKEFCVDETIYDVVALLKPSSQVREVNIDIEIPKPSIVVVMQEGYL